MGNKLKSWNNYGEEMRWANIVRRVISTSEKMVIMHEMVNELSNLE